MQPKRHRPIQLICNINVAGFVGVMLALLYLFIPISVDRHREAGVDLPRVWHPVSMARANREDAMIVVITRDDHVFFRVESINPFELPNKIRESVSQGSEKMVYIRADARAKYGWVAEVLDSVRSAGVEKIGFFVYEKGHVPVTSPQ
jgi:biopolymer transport protein ExbD/biopolymer transport protein TolR